MADRSNTIVQIPNGFPKITAGMLLADGRTLVTGHANGYVARWAVGSNSTPSILLRASSEVHAVIQSRNGEIFVGCNAGDLYGLASPSFGKVERILPPTNTKYTRVFRLAEPQPSTLLATSTYGVVNLLSRTRDGWAQARLQGHSHAVFAVAHEGDRLLATGDYGGNINFWERSGDGFEFRQRLIIDSYVSGLTFIGPQLLAAIGDSGHIFIFERQSETGTWRTIFETDTASGEGASIRPSLDARFVLAATVKEILKVDPTSQQVESAKVNGALALFPRADDVLILTPEALLRIPITEFTPKLDLVQYQYLKVSLLGNTSYGKTTLCSAITTGDPGSQLSTFGRRIWTWALDSGAPQRRVLLNDNGGQEQVIGTLLPLSADSDVILYFFKQTEIGGFRTALELRRRMKRLTAAGAKSFLVETYTDQPLTAVTDDHIRSQMASEGFDGVFKVSPTKLDQVVRFKEEFLRSLDWSRARPAVQSASVAGLNKTIEELKRKGRTVSNVGEIRTAFETTTGSSIYVYHLKFLLRNLTDSGQLEYYPKIGDTVVLDDPEFNRLRTDIPIFAGERGGIVRWSEIAQRYLNRSTYVAMLDLYYTGNDISIPFGDNQGRIFPAFLEHRVLNIPAEYSPFIAETGELTELYFAVSDPELPTLLTALCDMELDCVDATRNEGLFAWGPKALVYFHLVPSESVLEGPRLKVSFKVGGRDTEAVDSLRTQFRRLLQVLYGAPSEIAGAHKS